jgi:hypothetical protein
VHLICGKFLALWCAVGAQIAFTTWESSMNLIDAVGPSGKTSLPAHDAMHIAHVRIVTDKK